MSVFESIAGGIVLLLYGSQEYRLRIMREELNKKPSRDEVERLVELKNKPIEVALKSIKEDTRDVKEKIDKLIDRELNK